MTAKFTYLLILLLLSNVARADGGTLRLSQKVGPRQVAVFTSPTPPRAGVIDVSVLAQNSAGETDTTVKVRVLATRKDGDSSMISKRATGEAATNKLLQAAILDLPTPGLWMISVIVDDAETTFELEIAEPLPAWWNLAAWIAWPLLAVVLFAIHRRLVKRRNRGKNLFLSPERDLHSH
ncbi:hypothetical protein BH11PLA2_BH11PLA2_16740 [soil metagenome]